MSIASLAGPPKASSTTNAKRRRHHNYYHIYSIPSTMKFTASTVLLAALGLAEAKKGVKMTKKAFLRNVMKVDREGNRRLEGEDNAAILASDSLKFQKCVSLTIGPSDETGEYLFNDYYEYTQNGKLASKMDLAMFSICSYDDDGNCYYGGDGGDDELYMTPLANWLGNTYGIHAQAAEAYCQACKESQEVCQGNGEEEEAAEEEEADGEEEEQADQGEEGEEEDGEEEGEENDENEGRRALRKLANYVDCDTCYEKGCFDEDAEDGEDQEDEQDVVEFIEAFLECNQVELDEDEGGRRLENDEEMQFYATWCCNSDGDGVRLCLYLDEECSVEYSGESYYNLIEGSNQANAYSSSKTELGYTLHYPVSCMGEIEYDALENNDGDEEQQEEEEQEEEQEAAEFCQNLVGNEQGNNEEGAEVIALSNCYYGDEEEQNDEEEEAEEQDWGDYSYWYQVSANDAANFQTLCYAVQNLNGEGYWTVSEYNEGTYVEDSSAEAVNSAGLSTGAKAGIAAIVIAAVAALGFVVYKLAFKQADDADPKSFKLVDSKKGSMA